MKILLGQLESKKDCLYATILARQIKTDFPNCHLTWAITNNCKEIITENPDIDDIWVFEDNSAKSKEELILSFEKEAFDKQSQKQFDEVIFSQINPSNLFRFDGTTSVSILRAYNYKYTVPFEPQLFLNDISTEKVQNFVSEKNIFKYKNKILFEIDNKTSFNYQFAINTSDNLFELYPDSCLIFFGENIANIDDDRLIFINDYSPSEIAYLSNYCNLFIGCNNEYSIACRSNLSKKIPMIQLISKNQQLNAFSLELDYWGISDYSIIDLIEPSDYKLTGVIESILKMGFSSANDLFSENFNPKFNNYIEIISEKLLNLRKLNDLTESLYYTVGRFGWAHQLVDFFQNIKEIFVDNSNETFQILNESLDNYLKNGLEPDFDIKLYDDNQNIKNNSDNINLLEGLVFNLPSKNDDFSYLSILEENNDNIQENFEEEDYLITAIVSTYNSEKYIKGCIEDLIEQTIFEKTEVLIIDACSEQNEKEIIEKFQKKYKNIKYIRTETQETLYQSWNRAIKLAKGKYLTNANTDDRHRKDSFEILTKLLEENDEIGLVYADSLITFKDNDTIADTKAKLRYDWPDYNIGISLTTSIFGPQPVWRKSVHETVGYFDEELKIASDFDLFTRIAASFGALHLKETLGLFLARETSVSGKSNKDDVLNEVYTVLNYLREDIDIYMVYPNLESLENEFLKSIVYFNWANTLTFGPYPDLNQATKYYELALKSHETDPELYKNLAQLTRHNIAMMMIKTGRYDDGKALLLNNLEFIDSKNNLDILLKIENKIEGYSIKNLYPSFLSNNVLNPAQDSLSVYIDEEKNFIYIPNTTLFLDVYQGVDGIEINDEELKNIKALKPRLLSDKILDKKFLVSALVSCFNSEKFIKNKLDNLLEQTIGNNLEIIIINSGSEENEDRIVKEYMKNFKNISYYRTFQRESVYRAWNRAITISRGKYLTNSNTDDKLRKDALELMVKGLEQNKEYSLIYSDCLITENLNDTLSNNSSSIKYILPDANRGIFLSNSCFGPAPLWKKELHQKYGLFDENKKIAGDYEFFLKVSLKEKAIHLRESLSMFLQRPDSLSGSDSKFVGGKEIANICTFYRDNIELEELYDGLEEKKNNLHSVVAVLIDYANLWIMSPYGNFDKASVIFQKAMEISKFDEALTEEIKKIVKNNLAIFFYCINQFKYAFEYIEDIKHLSYSEDNYKKMKFALENKIKCKPNDFHVLELHSEIVENSRKSEYLKYDNNSFIKGYSYRRAWDSYYGLDTVDTNTDYKEYDELFAFKDLKEDFSRKSIEIHKHMKKSGSNKKRILFTMYGWEETGGGTQFPRELVLSLSKRGWEICVFYAAGNHNSVRTPYYLEEKTFNNIRLYGIFNRNKSFINAENPLEEIEDKFVVEKFNDVLNEFKPDLIHFHNFLGLSFKIAEIAHIRNIPSLFTPHNQHVIDPELYLINDDLSVWRSSNFFENSYLALKRKDLELDFRKRFEYTYKVLNEYINYTLAISNRVKELYVDFGINSNKIKVVHEIPESINFLTRQNRLPNKSKLRVAFIGSVIAIKGVHNLILALNEIDENKIQLDIYGDGANTYLENLKSLIKTNNIKWHGRYDYLKLNELSESTDLIVMPSIIEEGAGLVLLEALAMGIPVVASRIGGITDFIKNDINGKLFQYNSYKNLKSILLDFIDNPEKIIELSERAFLDKTREDFLVHLDKIYLSLLNNDEFIEKNGEFKINDSNQININSKNEMITDGMNRTRFNTNLVNGFSNNDAIGKLPEPLPNPLYLNLGCGKDIRDGFVNIDLFSDDPRVVKMDIRKLDIQDNIVDAIIASDVLEHFPHRETDNVLKEWNRVLKPGGEIIIRCPSLYLQCKAYMNQVWNADIASYMIFGGQTNPGDYHCIGFDEKSIKIHLENCGFSVEFFEEIDTPQSQGFINLNMTVRAIKNISTSEEKSKKSKDIKKKEENNYSLFANIESDNSIIEKIETPAIQNIANNKYNLNIVWEGSQFVYHSLALINREHCSNLIDTDLFELFIIPYENDAFSPEGNVKYQKLAQYDVRNKKENWSPGSPFVWIRHQWPPNPTPPQGSKWIINQPWEFSHLTKEFVEIFNKADEIWTPSNFSRNSFVNSGVDFNKVQIVPNGINPDIFKPGKSNFSLKTNKKLKFLFVGGTIYRKGIDVLLSSYVKTFDKNDDVCLVIKDIGTKTFYNGQTAQSLIDEIKKNPNSPEIIYLDESYSEEQIADLYRACTVFISPYRGEGFSLPTLEAMACGLPVIVTEGGATDDFVDGSVGWLIRSSKISIGNTLDGKELVDETFLLEPNEEHLCEIMKNVFENPSYIYIKGINASFKARTIWTWKKATLKLISRIDALYGTNYAIEAESRLEDVYDGYILNGLADEDYFNRNYEDAVNLYKLAIETNDLDNQTMQVLFLRMALIELINENFYTAEDFYNKANDIYVNTPDLTYVKIQMLAYERKWEELLEVVQDIFDNWQKYKFLIRTGFNLDDVFCDTANALFELDYTNDAIKLYDEALKANPENTYAYIGISKCFLAIEEFESAKEMLDLVLNLEPENIEANELRKNLI